MKHAKLKIYRENPISEIDPRLFGAFIEHLGTRVAPITKAIGKDVVLNPYSWNMLTFES